jgi:hypothetical protein
LSTRGSKQELHVRLVEAHDRGAVERHLVEEGDEGVAHCLEGAVVVEVLGVHGGDDGNRRRELEEGAVRFVGLGHQVLPLAEPGIGAQAQDAPADDDRRVEAPFRQHRADHRGGGRLAVRAGHRDAVLEPHQLREHLRARDHGDLALARGDDLDVLARHRRGVDDDLGALDVGGVVADEDLGAEPLEALDRLRALLVGARDRVAEVHEDLGDAGHPHAADAHEVDVAVALIHGRPGRC